MLGFLGKLLLTKNARDALERRRAPHDNAAPNKSTPDSAASIAAMQAQARQFGSTPPVFTGNDTMLVRGAKKKILAQLDNEDGVKRMGEAIKRLLHDEDRK